MFLEAVQGDRRAHIMQAPKLTVYNGQTATITGVMVRPQVQGMFPNQMSNGGLVHVAAHGPGSVRFDDDGAAGGVAGPPLHPLERAAALVAQQVSDPAAAIVTAVPQAIPTTL